MTERMNFIGATRAMNDGFTVAREGWLDPKYIYWATEHKQQAASKYVKQVNGRFKANNNRSQESFMHPTNILAEDWVVVGKTSQLEKNLRSQRKAQEALRELRQRRREENRKKIQKLREVPHPDFDNKIKQQIKELEDEGWQ